MGLPYRTVLTLACIVLAGRYVLDPGASPKGRWVVFLVTVISFVLPEGLEWYIAAVILQVTVSLFVLLRLRALS